MKVYITLLTGVCLLHLWFKSEEFLPILENYVKEFG